MTKKRYFNIIPNGIQDTKTEKIIRGSKIGDLLNEQEERIRELETKNKQLNQFINELTTKGTGRIDLANGYSYKINAVLTDFCGDTE